MIDARPTHSNAWSAPKPPVSSRTCFGTSGFASGGSASKKSVAPHARARSALSSRTSTAMIRSAPAIRADWSTDSPTPPRPNTTTDSPGRTDAACTTAP